MIKKDEKKISSSFEENIAYMDQVLPVMARVYTADNCLIHESSGRWRSAGERVFFILLTDL